MSFDNEGVRGPASLRINGMKVSELPLALRTQLDQEIPAFIEQERKNRVNAIIARYPKVTLPYCESKVLESQQNLVRFAAARAATIVDMEKHQDLIRNNEGRENDEVEAEVTELAASYVEIHWVDPELVNQETGLPIPGTLPFQQLRKKIKALNAQRKPYDENALWGQIKLFQENLGRYDEASKRESESILEVRHVMMLIAQRDKEISKAMSEPIAVE